MEKSSHATLNIYRSLILPHLTYGLVAWGSASKTCLNRILVLQKRALRLIHFVKTEVHAIPFFLHAKVLPIEFLYFQSLCNLMYDVDNRIAPQNILDLFTKVSSVHSYQTRSATSDSFYTQQSRLNIQRNAFSRVGVKVWNKIPNSLKQKSKKSFKEVIKQKLFHILESEDSYIEMDTLIAKF